MIIPDVNLLLYAVIEAFPEHPRARQWWEGLVNGQREVGLASPAVFGFIRVSTNPRIFATPLSVEAAISRVEQWMQRPHVRYLLPGPRHLETAFGLLRQLGAAANLTTDVQLAALALEVQGELHSNDGDFARFAGLRWVNPLASPGQ
jgi:toxin-antitoxin system PIN domain toxin